MKTKITIENGKTTVVLTPENEFEQNAVDNMNYKKISCHISNESGMMMGDNFIELNVWDTKNE